MSNPDNLRDSDQSTELLNLIEDALDKVAYSKTNHPVRVELRKQLEELKVNIRHNRIKYTETNNILGVIFSKIDILSQIEDLEARLTVKPEYPNDTHEWETENHYLLDQLKKLDNQLKPGLFDRIKNILR